MPSENLSRKQQAFVREYLKDHNQTQAALRAGYSPSSARQSGVANMANPSIRAAIDEQLDATNFVATVTRERIIREFARIAFADTTDAIWVEDGQVHIKDTSELTKDQTAAIAEINQTHKGDVRVKFHNKQAALDSLAKHFGMFVEKVEHSGRIDGDGERKVTIEFVRPQQQEGE